MRGTLLALVIEVARLGVGAQEVCPRTESQGVQGVVMLQVSTEATAAMKVTDTDAEGADVKTMAAVGSRHDGNHHSHVHLDHKLHAKHKAQHSGKHNDSQNSQLQKTFQPMEPDSGSSPTVGSCFASEYAYLLLFFIILCIGFLVGLYYAYKTIAKLKAKVRGQRARGELISIFLRQINRSFVLLKMSSKRNTNA